MTALTATFATVIALWMAWRGYRRGALATLVGWLPMLAALAVLVVLLWAAWSEPGRFLLLCAVAAVAALATFVVGTLGAAAGRRRFSKPPHSTAERRAAGRWLTACNRIAGAALGVFSAAFLSLAVACLASTIPFAVAMRAERPSHHGPPAPPSQWVHALRQSCRAMADVSHFGLLAHIPRMRTYSREVHALIRILNAPSHKLKHVAEKRGLLNLVELREVQDALLDDRYIALICRVGKGDLSALPDLVKSPVTRNIIECPEVRTLTKTLTPSVLASDLEEAAAEDEE